MSEPLHGLRVLDLTSYLSGPFATWTLSGLGAQIIKVERPGGGDPARTFPPFAGLAGTALWERSNQDDESVAILKRNRGKQCITLNLGQQEGRELALRLVRWCDVLVENLSPGVVEGWRLGYEDCRTVNPGIIYCSISGFGRQGPMSDLPAFDPIVQAATATMASNGYPDTPPTRMGISFGDTVPALYADIGILAALHQRHETGRGCRIDISMADALVAMLLIEPLEAQLEWGFPLRVGSRIPRLVPCNVYRCRDGYVALNAAPPRQWERLVAALSIPELKDPALVPLAARIRRGDWVDATVSRWLAERSCAEVLRLTREHGVPCAKVVETLTELIADGHFQDRGMIQPVEHPTLGSLPDLYAPGVPIFLDGAPPAQLAPARPVGADTRPILRQLLGLTDEELDRLEQQGIV